ncbi:MAG: O-antigen ligase family protein [Candidatus Competibacter sp.]
MNQNIFFKDNLYKETNRRSISTNSYVMHDGVIENNWPRYFYGSHILFMLFLIYIVYWYLQGSFRFPILSTIRFEFLMGFVLSLFGVQTYFKNPNRKKSEIGLWLVMLFISMITMIFFSYVPEISFNLFIDRVIKFSLLGFFIAAFVTTPKRLALFICFYLFSFFKMGQEGLLGHITGSLVWENQGVLRLNGPTPNYSHPNSFSGMALGTLPFIFYFFSIVDRYFRLILLVQLLFSLNIIIFTGSRTGYVALVIGLLFFILKSSKPIKTFFTLLIVLLIAMPLIPSGYIERAETIFTQKDKEGNSTGTRKEILRDAWTVFLDNPLGVGVGAFPAVRQQRFGRTQDTHNLYLEIGTNLGIQGLIIFFGLIFALLRILSRLVKNLNTQSNLLEGLLLDKPSTNISLGDLQKHKRDLQIMRATCQSIYLFVILRLGLGLFGMDLYEIYWWFACGTAVAVWNINTVAQSRTVTLVQLSKM